MPVAVASTLVLTSQAPALAMVQALPPSLALATVQALLPVLELAMLQALPSGLVPAASVPTPTTHILAPL